MKKIGIVGGIAWQSTVEYYSELCRKSEQWHVAKNPSEVAHMPEISIESLDLAKAIAYLGSDDDERSWTQFDNYHHAALKRLEATGADFALIASNTPHHRFESIVDGIKIPVINIVDEMAKESVRIGAPRVLLLGTAQTMESPKFCAKFQQYGIKALGPESEKARSMTTELIRDLQQGETKDAALRLSKIAKVSFQAEPASPRPAVCLACTELPLAFPNMKRMSIFEYEGVFYINSSLVHINAAFEFAVA